MMEALFYIFCTTLPSHIIPFTMFWDFPWRSRTAALGLVVFNVLCKITAAAYFIANGMSFRNMELLFAVLGFGIYVCFLRLDFFKMLFTFLLIVDYLLVIRGISSFIAVQIARQSTLGWASSWCSLILYTLSLPFLLRFFRRIANQIYRTNAPSLWGMIWLVPGIFTGMTLLFTNGYLDSSAESWLFLLCRVGLLVCVFVIYHVLLQSLESLQKQVALEQRLKFEQRLIEIQMEEQKKQSLLILQNAEQTRQMRHDLRHQLTAIQTMAGNENPQLRAYIGTLIQDIPAAVQVYCENTTVNAVVSHYAARCQQEGIAFTARLTVPAQNPNMTDSALCVIFANLLENAVEACERMGGGEKFIRLNSSLEYGILTITMDNSFNGKAIVRDGNFYSSKRPAAPGIGLSSIQAMARTYGGDARFEVQGTTFLSSVYGKL